MAIQGIQSRPAGVVGLGDSVPAGTANGGHSFVDDFGADSGAAVTNFASPGATVGDVEAALKDPKVRASLKSAGTILLNVGANDLNQAQADYLAGKISAQTLYGRVLGVQTRVRNLLTDINQLKGFQTQVGVVDYWSVFEDGKVASSKYTPAQRRVFDHLTRALNQVLQAEAGRAGDVFVDDYAALKGLDGERDPTSLLATDGNHPNAAGHRLIAQQVEAAGLAAPPPTFAALLAELQNLF